MREYRWNSSQHTKSKMFPVSHTPGPQEILFPLSQEQVPTTVFKLAGPALDLSSRQRQETHQSLRRKKSSTPMTT